MLKSIHDNANIKLNIVGKVMTIIQMILSICILVQLNFLPGKYLIVMILVLFGLFAITFTMQFIKRQEWKLFLRAYIIIFIM